MLNEWKEFQDYTGAVNYTARNKAANFDAHFGTTSFGRKHLKQIPKAILERSETGFGLCRYRLGDALINK